MSETRLRVLIADDQPMVRLGLTLIVDHEPDMTVVAEAADGMAAVRRAAATAPDVVLMDIRMPGLDGIEATRSITTARAQSRVLVLTTFSDDDYVVGALRAGASGFLLKDAEPADLLAAIRHVHAGDALLDPTITRTVVERWLVHERAPEPVGQDPSGVLAGLTEREREVLTLVARGLSNRGIGEALTLSEATVKSHVHTVLGKLGLVSRTQAVVVAYETGLVRPGDPRN